MAKTDWIDDVGDASGAFGIDGASHAKAGGLKRLLSSIVDQLSDADRRHTDALQHMQEKLASMGKDATTMRSRIPDQFAPAFERIESGVAELAYRISESSSHSSVTSDIGVAAASSISYGMPPVAPARSAHQLGEGPKALRSAEHGFVATPRQTMTDDAFDVIESSLPEADSNPWQSASADVLKTLYAPSDEDFRLTNEPHRTIPSSPPSDFATTVDEAWLEMRFADIARRLDESIADIRPDQAFFALGQRLESVEQNVSQALQEVAGRSEVEAIRIIETHIGEIANHLDHTSGQLSRLDLIETQLHEIAERLAGAQRASSDVTSDSARPFAEDVHAVAHAAVEQAMRRFADIVPAAPASGNDDMRHLMQTFMSESRQGEETTNALLDTLQQAMIRLLDRVDAMEESQHNHTAYSYTTPLDIPRENLRFESEPTSSAALNAAVAAVALAQPVASPEPDFHSSDYSVRVSAVAGEQSAPPQPMRGPDKIRQDFIADARRAKLRLAAADEAGDHAVMPTVASNSASQDAAGRRPITSGNAAVRSKVSPKNSARPTSARRLTAMALGAMAIVGGLWVALDAGNSQPMIATPAGATAPNGALDAGSSAGPVTEKTGTSDNAAKSADGPAEGTAGNSALPTPDVNDGRDQSGNTGVPEGTRGEIVPDNLTVGQTSVPMLGIAVESKAPMSAGEMERAQRRQSMAAMSSKLGRAAASINNGISTPISLLPSDAEHAAVVRDGAAAPALPKSSQSQATASMFSEQQTSALTGGAAQSAALDLPPAVVGPLSLRLAAANGDPSAEFDVGARLAEGKGGVPNYKEAAKWYQRSADRGFAQSQYRLGTLYERGLGLKADPARAQSWYERAAELGNTKAMHNLAVLSANQNHGSPDYATAARWFTQAADRGLSDSQFNLAVLHENGLGVPADLLQAYKWLSLAARGGDKEAIRRRDILKGKLTAEDLAKAEDLLRSWKPKATDALTNDARTAGDAWKKNPQNGVNG